MQPGKIIFLNGSSSAGKTCLALALQNALDQPYLHIALDQFRDSMPPAYRGLNSPKGTHGAEGLNVVPVSTKTTRYTEIRFGTMGRTVLRGMRRAIAAIADAGSNVLIDDILLEPSFLDDYLDCLSHLSVTFVGVRCPLPVIEQREAARPGRFPGTAKGHFSLIHTHGLYDIEVDTSLYSPDACATLVIEHMDLYQPCAFEQLRARRTNQAAIASYAPEQQTAADRAKPSIR